MGEIELVRTVEVAPAPAEGTVMRGMFPSESRGRALIRSVTPAAQAVVVAAGGFVAGAAVIGLATRRRGKPGRGRNAKGRARKRASGKGELVRIVGTRSLLVDVHLLEGGR
jgi:hypothetical protein